MTGTSTPIAALASPRKGKAESKGTETTLKNRDWDLVVEDEDLDRRPGFLGLFLKKNSSPMFLADIALMNARPRSS